jgi:hypothetical protein
MLQPDYFKNVNQLNQPTTDNLFTVFRNKKGKLYSFCDPLGNEILFAKPKNSYTYIIIDKQYNQLAEIEKFGNKNNKFHKLYKLFFKKKDYSQIIAVHQNNHKNSNTISIPTVIQHGSGINSFKSLDKMYENDNNENRRLIMVSNKFIQPAHFVNCIDSIKNCQYYQDLTIKFELVKESSNKFNVYLDNPLSIVQGFMLALINIRI